MGLPFSSGKTGKGGRGGERVTPPRSSNRGNATALPWVKAGGLSCEGHGSGGGGRRRHAPGEVLTVML